MVLPWGIDTGALASVSILGQQTVAHGGTALEGKAELATISEAADNVVAVDGAL